MVPTWLTALLLTLGEAWSICRDVRLRFLLAQIELLKIRVPGNRVILSPEERLRVLKLGAVMDHHVDELVGIASVKTYKRWRAIKPGGVSGEPPYWMVSPFHRQKRRSHQPSRLNCHRFCHRVIAGVAEEMAKADRALVKDLRGLLTKPLAIEPE
jgi:hypothetical protein